MKQSLKMRLTVFSWAALSSTAMAQEPITAPPPEPTTATETSPAVVITKVVTPAAVAEPVAAPPCQESNKEIRYKWLRMAHSTLGNSSCKTAMWLDGLFGDAPNLDAAAGTRGRLDTELSYSEFSGTDLRVRLNVRIALPSWENRLSAFIGRSDEETFVQDAPEMRSLDQQFSRFQNNDQWLAGLGYSLPSGERYQSSFRVGVRNVRKPRAFAQYRFFYSPYGDALNLVYLRATPFWNSIDRFGATAGAEYNRILSPTRLLRLLTSGTITERSEGLNWIASGIVYQDLKKGRGISPEIFIRGETDEPEPINEYGIRVTYRQPIVTDALYGRIAPAYSWPRDNPSLPRNGSAGILLGLEIPFGSKQ